MQHEEQESEQANHNGGQRRKRLNGRFHEMRQAVLRSVLSKVDRAAKRDRHRNKQREHQQIERVEQLGANAAAFLELLGLAREEAHVKQLARTARHNVRDKREQQHANRSHDGEQHARGKFILQGNAASKGVFRLLALRSIRRPLRRASPDDTPIGDHFVNTSDHWRSGLPCVR